MSEQPEVALAWRNADGAGWSVPPSWLVEAIHNRSVSRLASGVFVLKTSQGTEQVELGGWVYLLTNGKISSCKPDASNA